MSASANRGAGAADAHPRLGALAARARGRGLDCVLVFAPPAIRALTGVECDSACLEVAVGPRRVRASLYTDFRYVPMVHRVAPWLEVRDIRRLGARRVAASGETPRIGYEPSVAHSRYLALRRQFPGARFVDFSRELDALRAVKDADEIAALRAAEALNDEIWREASARFAPGMSERDMARLVRHLMIDRGDGEAFETIVCVGRNAAECHHVPDGTVWTGREPVLVDMGVKLGGWCSDMTRNVVPERATRAYREVYDLVLRANLAAIAAARPGMTGRELDGVARDLIARAGYGRCFGHSLGHGVGLEIHEAPYASAKSAWTLEPGMLVTVEPGVYVEGELGVRIEDLVLITETGCEVLSASAK